MDKNARPYVTHDKRDGRRCDMTLRHDSGEGEGSRWCCPACGARFIYQGPGGAGLGRWDPDGREGEGAPP